MEKRLTARDAIFYTVLVALVALLILIMYQQDRHWTKLQQIQAQLAEQAKETRDLRAAISSGQLQVATNTTGPEQGKTSTQIGEVAPAFQRAKAATQLPDYAQGDWSVGAFGTNLATISPLVSQDAYSSQVQDYVLESLISRDPDTLEWQGFIAKDWQISPDGLTIIFNLRQDVAFSDGVPLTADDVVFSYNFIMNPAIDAPRQRSYYEKIKSVQAPSKYQVVFTFTEPYFEALSLAGGIAIMAKHFYEPYLENPQQFNQSKGLLLGSGPYKLADPKTWTPDQGSVELIRNDRYWGDVKPSYNRIVWKIIQNDSARLTTYRNGEIDSYGARPIEYAKLKADAQMMDKSQNFEYMPPTGGYSWIGWNQEKNGKPSWFADKRVRQAMTYMTDTARIINDVFLGYAEAAVSPFSPTSKQHDQALKPYEFNLQKAQQLLKEAGYEDRNADSVIENSAGEPFEFKLTYFQDNEDTKRMVLLLRDIYAKAGVRMIPMPQEWPVMLDAMNKRDFDAITLAWTSGIETDIYQMFHSSQTQDGGDNFINYKNPELDKLIEQARSTVDDAKRMPLWQQAERIMYEDQPYTFLTRSKTLAFIDKRIHNIQMTKMGLNRGMLPLENYVPSTLQRYKQ